MDIDVQALVQEPCAKVSNRYTCETVLTPIGAGMPGDACTRNRKNSSNHSHATQSDKTIKIYTLSSLVLKKSVISIYKIKMISRVDKKTKYIITKSNTFKEKILLKFI